MIREKVRKIAANYIYLPGYTLVKNGYVELGCNGEIRVTDTGGRIKEIAGLEFYGGLIVPGFVCEASALFENNVPLLTVLDQLYAQHHDTFNRIAIIEGADLREMTWKSGARIRLL